MTGSKTQTPDHSLAATEIPFDHSSGNVNDTESRRYQKTLEL